MGRPRRNSNKSDSGSTAGNVYNASLAAAQQQKAIESSASPLIIPSPTVPISSSLTPKLDVISLNMSAEIEKEKINSSNNNNITNITNNNATITNNNSTTSIYSTNSTSASTAATPSIHRRSLSIAELVSLVSSRNQPANHQNSALPALAALNLPEALRSTLEKADSPILNALLPLIRQKLADKTSSNRRNSAVDPSDSTSSLENRRSSTSSRSEDHRLSHKLAERKRRKEMKDVFDDLKDVLPPGVPKSSKWEILNEASSTIDDLLSQEQALLIQRNQLLKRISESKNN